jgi:hypothetical protein
MKLKSGNITIMTKFDVLKQLPLRTPIHLVREYTFGNRVDDGIYFLLNKSNNEITLHRSGYPLEYAIDIKSDTNITFIIERHAIIIDVDGKSVYLHRLNLVVQYYK